MNLLTMNDDNCLLYSVAMLLNENPEELAAELGVDSQEEVFDAPGCFKKRGYHIQEMQMLCIKRGLILACLEARPAICVNQFAPSEDKKVIECFPNVEDRMVLIRELIYAAGDCLLLTDTHAVACDGDNVFDPRGSVYPLDEMKEGVREIYFVCEFL